jgi:hypothetical protein
LKAGDFYCYGPAFAHDGVTLMKSGQVQTTHPKAGQGRTLKPPKPSSAILAMLDELKDLPQEAEQQIRDLSEARKKIAELERSLRMASRAAETPKPADKADPKAVIELRTINRAQAMQIKQLKQGMELAMKVMTKIDSRNFMAAGVDPAQIEEAIKRAAKEIVKLAEQKMTAKQQEFERWKKECQKALSIMQKLINAEEIQVQMNITHRDPVMIDSPRPARPAPTYDGPTDEAGRNSLTDVERDILDSAASFPNGATKKRLSIHSGRSIKSSSFGAVFAGGEAHPDKERASLVQRGLLQQEGDRYLVTEAGAALARPSSGVSLQDWYQKLQPSESNVLRCRSLPGSAHP